MIDKTLPPRARDTTQSTSFSLILLPWHLGGIAGLRSLSIMYLSSIYLSKDIGSRYPDMQKNTHHHLSLVVHPPSGGPSQMPVDHVALKEAVPAILARDGSTHFCCSNVHIHKIMYFKRFDWLQQTFSLFLVVTTSHLTQSFS